MNTCFADTAYFVALLSPSDVAHAAALAQARVTNRIVVSSSAVLNELGNQFVRPPDRAMFVDFTARLRRNAAFRLVHVDEQLFDRGLDFYGRHHDKLWSLTDCISFVIMHDMTLTDALTSDRHFEQAGFRALLKP